MSNEFSVYHEGEVLGKQTTVTECRFVSKEEACETFVRLINMPAAKIGITKRVIITDGGDFTNMEWIHGKGVTFPPKLAGRDLTPRNKFVWELEDVEFVPQEGVKERRKP